MRKPLSAYGDLLNGLDQLFARGALLHDDDGVLSLGCEGGGIGGGVLLGVSLLDDGADKAYWERCMRGKAQSIAGTYDIKFRVFDEYTARLAAATNVDISDGSMESSSVNRTYDPPEATISIIPDVAEEFLAEQNRTDFNQKTYGGLEAATVREYMDAVEDPHEAYAREFDKLFYWGI